MTVFILSIVCLLLSIEMLYVIKKLNTLSRLLDILELKVRLQERRNSNDR